ncbi:MAG: TIGR03668 family PPOX class F420-dependent oxidoreductase [Nocardiopsaceae bacterium]|nr:TIGR03668 family PPOX class F420-dependent oxidoreductase [Nocardiopsaceae bacterium]
MPRRPRRHRGIGGLPIATVENVKLTEAEARERLAASRVARLATAGDDRRPHVVPVTFAVDGDRIYTAIDHKPKTTANLRRLRNIRENPRVALLADHYEEDWDALWWTRADGRASIVEEDSQRARPLDVLAAKYEQYRRARPVGPVIVIEVERWTGWESGFTAG